MLSGERISFLCPVASLVGLRSLIWTVGLSFFNCLDDFSFMLMVRSAEVFAVWHQTPFGARPSGLSWV
jgi:hypothetical protein